MMVRLLGSGLTFLLVIGLLVGLVEGLWLRQLTTSWGVVLGGAFALLNCLVLMMAFGPAVLRQERHYRAPLGLLVSLLACGCFAFYLSQSESQFCLGAVFGLASPVGFGLLWSTKWQLGG